MGIANLADPGPAQARSTLAPSLEAGLFGVEISQLICTLLYSCKCSTLLQQDDRQAEEHCCIIFSFRLTSTPLECLHGWAVWRDTTQTQVLYASADVTKN